MKCVEVHVIDSSAIFQRKAVYRNMVTVPEVVAEILDEASALYFSVKTSGWRRRVLRALKR